MSWVKLDDQLPDHPKMLDLSDAAFRLWVYSLCKANARGRNGMLLARQVQVVCAYFSGSWQDLAGELVSAGLWDVVDGGWMIHDYEEYQPTADPAADREAERRARNAERMRDARARTVHARDAHAKRTRAEDPMHTPCTDHARDAHKNGADRSVSRACAPPDPTRPDPKEEIHPQPPGGAAGKGQQALALVAEPETPVAPAKPSRAAAQSQAVLLLGELSAARIRVNRNHVPLKPVESNLREIRGRLLEGNTVDDVRHVIAVSEARARSDPEAAKYFDAVSPFRVSNFGMWRAKTLDDAPARTAGSGLRPVTQTLLAMAAEQRRKEEALDVGNS